MPAMFSAILSIGLLLSTVMADPPIVTPADRSTVDFTWNSHEACNRVLWLLANANRVHCSTLSPDHGQPIFFSSSSFSGIIESHHASPCPPGEDCDATFECEVTRGYRNCPKSFLKEQMTGSFQMKCDPNKPLMVIHGDEGSYNAVAECMGDDPPERERSGRPGVRVASMFSDMGSMGMSSGMGDLVQATLQQLDNLGRGERHPRGPMRQCQRGRRCS